MGQRGIVVVGGGVSGARARSLARRLCARALSVSSPFPQTPQINNNNTNNPPSHESVALSFNGGKDSTVLLHLLRLALFGPGEDEEEEEEQKGGGNANTTNNANTSTNGLRGVRSFYFDTSAPAAAASGIAEEQLQSLQQQQQNQQPPGDFGEVAAFVRATDAAYGLGVEYLTDRDFKRGLERYCAGGGGGGGDDDEDNVVDPKTPPTKPNRPPVAAILLGTRRGDPNADGQDHFCPSSRGWPPFLRVNPVLDWGYGDVWRFLRVGQLPYCSLYDRGYTSLGSPATTAPNAALRRADGSFAPAHELSDGRLERQGRRSMSAGGRGGGGGKGQQQGAAAAADAAVAAASPSSASLPPPAPPLPPLPPSSISPSQPQQHPPPTTSTRTRYAVVVLVGDELLAGRVRDANGPFLCAELRAIGWAVRRVVIVPDDVESVALAVAAASRDADAVLTAGGVGPTRDDVTMAGVAGAIERGGGRLLRHPEAERALVDYFGATRVTEAHLKMAEVPGAGDVELVWVEEEEDGVGEENGVEEGQGQRPSSQRRPSRRCSPFPLVRVNNIYVLPGVPSFLMRKWVEVRKRLRAMDGEGKVGEEEEGGGGGRGVGAAEGGGDGPAANASTANEHHHHHHLLLPFKSATLRLHAPDEAAVAPCLDALADERGAAVSIGSYPVDVWGGRDGVGGAEDAATRTTATRTTTLRVVLESKDSAGLDAAVDRLTELLRERLGEGALLGVERSGGDGGGGAG